MKISRRKMIQAVRTEPLMGGSWIDDQSSKSCPVCAVGAVLRTAGVPPREIIETVHLNTGRGEYIEAAGEADALERALEIAKENPLEALSRYHETIWWRPWISEFGSKRSRVTAAYREKLVDFIKQAIPPEGIEITRVSEERTREE